MSVRKKHSILDFKLEIIEVEIEIIFKVLFVEAFNFILEFKFDFYRLKSPENKLECKNDIISDVRRRMLNFQNKIQIHIRIFILRLIL